MSVVQIKQKGPGVYGVEKSLRESFFGGSFNFAFVSTHKQWERHCCHCIIFALVSRYTYEFLKHTHTRTYKKDNSVAVLPLLLHRHTNSRPVCLSLCVAACCIFLQCASECVAVYCSVLQYCNILAVVSVVHIGL